MSALRATQQQWTNPRTGHALFARFWTVDDAAATVMLVHGFGEHSGRYEALAQLLAADGLSSGCLDLPGHGRSGGRRGDLRSVDDYLDDLDAMAAELRAAHPTGRVAVFGHSFGGLVALCWTLRAREQPDSLVMQSPLFAVGYAVPAWKRSLANLLARIWPTCPLTTGLDPAWLSHDQAVVEAYRADPLVVRHVTARGYRAIDSAMRRASREASTLRPATLMLCGEGDRVVSVAAARRVFDALTCDKHFETFPDAYHELHHEAARDRAAQTIAAWIRAHGR